MIDYESAIFNEIYDAVIAEFPNCTLKSELDLEPATSPVACVEEINNATYSMTGDSESIENHAVVSFEVNVFSSKPVGRKTEAKAILGVIDDVLAKYNFAREMTSPASLSDSTRYRLVARYTAVVSKNGIFYRR